MFRSILVLLALTGLLGAAGNEGVLNGSPAVPAQNGDESRRSSADWYNGREINISDSTADTLTMSAAVAPGARVKQIINNSGSVATVKLRFRVNSTFHTLKIPAYGTTGKIPSVYSIMKSGSSDSLFLLWQMEY